MATADFPAAEARDFDIRDMLERRCMGARLSVTRKDRLFTTIAEAFASVYEHLSQEDLERALWEREHTQNTAVGMGLALPHATMRALKEPCLGIFTMAEPLDYGAPDGEPVDVIFVTLGPPSGRRVHLELLSSLSSLVLSTNLLADLRTAANPQEIEGAFDRHTKE